MKSLVLGLVLGLAGGGILTGDYYRGKIERVEAAQLKAEVKRNDEIAGLATYWQKLLDDANSVEPAVITERVFVRVKASCVQATNTDGLADGAATDRVEIAESTVRSVKRVVAQAEQQYRECSHRLRSVQDAFTRPQ